MKRLTALLTCLMAATICIAQDYLWSPDSLSATSPNFAMNKYNHLLNYHDQMMYLTYPVIYPIESRKVPLRDGEGKSGYWLEGNFSNRFIIHKGKYYNPELLQRLRLTFDVRLTPRLTQDNSSPLLPSNNEFGLGVDFLVSSLSGLLKDYATPAWLTIQLHHYSNGQADSFFIVDDEGNQRNNYRSGSFSTNFLRLVFNIANVASDKYVFSGGAGWQKEMDLGGPFEFSPEMKKSYGKQRALLYCQWLSVSRLVTTNSIFSTAIKKIAKKRQFLLRTELEYILDDLSNFPLDRKYRLGGHVYLTYMPSITNEVGFMIHAYAGRDYLNIRFDDIVFIGEAGLYMRINKR